MASQLAATATWAAAVRARETARPDRLFEDPWADALAGEEGRAWAADRSDAALAPMVLRTRFYDDFVHRAVVDDGVRQVVLLAAGFDTRAYRTRWPDGVVLHELDREPVLRRKQEVLDAVGAEPACTRRVCPADLADPAWPGVLVGSGFDPGRPSVWLAEGFLFYLPPDVVPPLLARVGELVAPGGALGFDIVDTRVLTHPLTRAWVQMQADAGAPWTGTLDDPRAALEPLGWDVALNQCGDPAANFGRWPYPVVPAAAPDLPHHWLVTARKVR